MNDIFKLRNIDTLTREKYELNLEIPKPNQATFGTKYARSCGTEMWNGLTYHIKTSENLNIVMVIIELAECGNIQLQDNRLLQKTKTLNS